MMERVKKYCKECGKYLGDGMFDGYQFSDLDLKWGDPGKIYYLCRTHRNEKVAEDTKRAILNGEYGEEPIDESLLGTDGVFCPHCGEYVAFEPVDDCELYEDGGHCIDCPECRKEFWVDTSVSYYFESRRC